MLQEPSRRPCRGAQGAAAGLILPLLMAGALAAAPSAVDAKTEALLRKTKELSTEDKTLGKTGGRWLKIAVLVPKRTDEEGFKALAAYYRLRYQDLPQVEIDFWDQKEAYRLDADEEILDKTRYTVRQTLDNESHWRAMYRKNPAMKDDSLSLFRARKVPSDPRVLKVIRF